MPREIDNGSHFTNADRVLITKLDVKVERLISDMTELKNNYAQRLDRLELEKLAKNEADRLIAAATQELKDNVSTLQKIVYGCVAAILLGFIGVVIQDVLHKCVLNCTP